MCKITNMPIKWFGDKKAYFESDIKIVTVGLNPSDQEFVNCSASKPGGDRFPNFDGNIHGNTLDAALNEYFMTQPYSEWFDGGFEPILNGMDASYYDDKNHPRRVIHTDFCTWWATNPTWSRLNKNQQASLMEEGNREWINLISDLDPNILLFSIRKEYYLPLFKDNKNIQELMRIEYKKDGTKRKKPIIIYYGIFERRLAIFGQTWNMPFGGIDVSQKKEISDAILKKYYELKRLSNVK